MKEKMGAEGGQVVLYRTEDGRTRLEVRLEDGTVWLTQAQIAELYQTTRQNVSLFKNILAEGELLASSVVKESLTTASDGKRYRVRFYNVDLEPGQQGRPERRRAACTDHPAQHRPRRATFQRARS